MRESLKVLSVALIAIFVLTTCEKDEGSLKSYSPKELVKRVVQAGKLKNGALFYDSLSANSAKKFETKLRVFIKATLFYIKKSLEKKYNAELKKKYKQLIILSKSEGREFFQLFFQSNIVSIKKITGQNYKIISEKINKDKALIIVDSDGVIKKFEFIKEAGLWKIDFSSTLDPL